MWTLTDWYEARALQLVEEGSLTELAEFLRCMRLIRDRMSTPLARDTWNEKVAVVERIYEGAQHDHDNGAT